LNFKSQTLALGNKMDGDGIMKSNHQKGKRNGNSARTQQAEARTKEANTLTDQANTRTKEANTLTDQANTRTEQANTRTERSESNEQALRASELSYRRLFESARDGILILDVDTGRISDVNPFLVEMLGFSHSEMVGKTVGELSPFKDIKSNKVMLEQLQKDGYVRYEDLPLETRDGRKIAVEFVSNVYQAGDKKVIQCNVRDITERKLAELALNRLAAIVESSDDAIIGKDLNSIVTSWNNGAEKIFGYSSDEMVGNSILRLIPADRQREETEFLARTNHGESVRQFETVRQAKGGRLLNISVTISPIKDASGKIIGISKVARDITWRKNAEDVLRESERRFRDMLENLELIAMTLDKNAKVTFCNDYLLQMTGWQRGEIIGADWFEKFIPDTNVALKKLFFETIEAHGFPSHVESSIKTKTGELREIVWNNTMLRNGDGKITGTASIGEDVTGHKKLEEQFRQSQKMDAIGQLAGGVAHDFNNILAVIQLQADLLKIGGNLSPEQLEFAEEIGVASQRASALTRQLLLFSRKETLKPHDLDLNQSLSAMTNMLRRILGEDIQIQFKFAMESLFIHADAGMMDQVLLNLTVNARDAMPKGGRLVIETSAVDFDESVIGQTAQARPGSFVCLSVSDTGYGIPKENLSRIFEPFFTTKEVGKGTGLGLATLFGIVQQHQGWVNVYSEVGQGTTFRIFLPRLANMSSQKSEQPKQSVMRGGNESILLVEDDAFLHASVRKILSHLGYHVLDAANGVEALAVWKQNRDSIHLLLTDLVMPGGITGIDLAARLLKKNPKLKVIYASGYSAEVAGKDFPLEEGINFLIKPFQALKLAQTVRERLDAI
jgi:PAS domain S-box-containing protein